jgi:hypothetical protein
MDTSLGDEEDQREHPSHSGGLVLLKLVYLRLQSSPG